MDYSGVNGVLGRTTAGDRRLVFLPTETSVRDRCRDLGTSPDLLVTFKGFFERAYVSLGDGLPWMSDLARNYAIERLIDDAHKADKLTNLSSVHSRPGVRDGLVLLLPELKRRGVRPEHLAGIPGPSCHDFVDQAYLYGQYRKQVRDGADREWLVLQALQAGGPLPVWTRGCQSVLVDEIDLLMPAQHRLLDVLLVQGLALEFSWPLAQTLVQSLEILASQDAWLRRLESRFPGKVVIRYRDESTATGRSLNHVQSCWNRSASSPQATDESIELIEAPSVAVEVDAIARHVRNALETVPDLKGSDIAVVLRDPSTYRELVAERFARHDVPIYQRRGQGLAGSHLFRYLRSLLQLPGNQYEGRALLAVLQSTYCPFFRKTEGGETISGAVIEELLATWKYVDEEKTPLHRQIELCRVRCDREREWREKEGRSTRSIDRDLAISAAAGAAIAEFLQPLKSLAEVHDLERQSTIIKAVIKDKTHLGGTAELIQRDRYVSGTVERLIDEIHGAILAAGFDSPMTLDDWIRALEWLAEEITIPDVSHPEGVQVVSVQDLRGRQYKYLYVLGMQEGGFPRPRSSQPLLREPVRKVLSEHLRNDSLPELPDAKWWNQMEHVHFARILAAVRECLVLSVPVTEETMEEYPPGKFYIDVANLFTREANQPTTLPRQVISLRETVPPLDAALTREDLHARLAMDLFMSRNRLADTFSNLDATGEAAAKEQDLAIAVYEGLRQRQPEQLRHLLAAHFLEVERNRAMENGTADSYAGRWSADGMDWLHKSFQGDSGDLVARGREFETFGQCPFRFVAEHALNLEPMPEVEEGIGFMERGSLVHTILERFMRESRSRIDPPRDRPRLMAIADEELQKCEEAGIAGAGDLWIKERTAITSLLDRFLSNESACQRDEGWHPILFEYFLGGVPVQVAGKTVRVRGRVDRVDFSSTLGRPRIVDYKDSSREHSDEEFELGTLVQIGLYALGLENEESEPLTRAGWPIATPLTDPAAAYYSLKRKDDNVIQRLSTFDTPGWRPIMLQHLARYVASFETGEFPVLPVDDACKYCKLGTFCRVTRATLRREE